MSAGHNLNEHLTGLRHGQYINLLLCLLTIVYWGLRIEHQCFMHRGSSPAQHQIKRLNQYWFTAYIIWRDIIWLQGYFNQILAFSEEKREFSPEYPKWCSDPHWACKNDNNNNNNFFQVMKSCVYISYCTSILHFTTQCGKCTPDPGAGQLFGTWWDMYNNVTLGRY